MEYRGCQHSGVPVTMQHTWKCNSFYVKNLVLQVCKVTHTWKRISSAEHVATEPQAPRCARTSHLEMQLVLCQEFGTPGMQGYSHLEEDIARRTRCNGAYSMWLYCRMPYSRYGIQGCVFRQKALPLQTKVSEKICQRNS